MGWNGPEQGVQWVRYASFAISTVGSFHSISNNFIRLAPTIAGMPNKNEKRVESMREYPNIRVALIVVPERLAPGNKAKHSKIPIIKASYQGMLNKDLFVFFLKSLKYNKIPKIMLFIPMIKGVF